MPDSSQKPADIEIERGEADQTVGRPLTEKSGVVQGFEPNTLIYDADSTVSDSPVERSRQLGQPKPDKKKEELPLPFERIAHFRIVGRIGQGGMGTVYRANDEYLQRLVALKVIGTGTDKELDLEQTQRLLREARAASRISHPNVVTVYAAGEHEGVSFIAMEYVEGQELADLIGSGLDTERALSLAVQIAEGLGAAHEQGIVHRDVKPANVLVCPGDRVKILDFGLAKPAVRGLGQDGAQAAASEARLPEGLARSEDVLNVYQTQTGVVWGSLHYMSPEQACGDPLDARTDLFSLGVVLYQMLSGQLPWFGKKPMDYLTAMMRDEPPPLRSVRMRIPDSVQAIVSKALAKDRDLRYSSAHALAADLRTTITRLKDFGDVEFEDLASKVAAKPAQVPGPPPVGPLTIQPKPPPKPTVRYDHSFLGDNVAFQPPGSQFDVTIVSPNTYPWQPKRLAVQGMVANGTAISIHGDVYEVVAIDKHPGVVRYFLSRWPQKELIRKVHPYTPEFVASFTEERPKSGAFDMLTGFFSKKRRD